MRKITKSTIKSFIRKNREALYINLKSHFDGMTDGIEQRDGGIVKAYPTEEYLENTLGISGAWFVGGSRNYFTPYEDENFTGYEVSNCCGVFQLLIKK